MKIIHNLILFGFCLLLASSCQRELFFEPTNAKGFLLKTAQGDCAPINVSGNYIKSTSLSASNYMDVQVNFTTIGPYDIKSDTVNGFHFRGLGEAIKLGIATIRLFAEGTPTAVGINLFKIKFDTSTCNTLVTVISNVNSAVFTLGGAPNNCTGALLAGVYSPNSPMVPTNTVTLNVSVTQMGAYDLSTGIPINGVIFSGSGNLNSIGASTIVLEATGTPTVAGTFLYPVTVGGSTCKFSVTFATVLPGTYTINCSAGVVYSGAFSAALPLTSSNSVSINVTTLSAGLYNITTNSVNGVSFAATGVFPAAGTYDILLKATGNVPTLAGIYNYTTIGGIGSCSFPVTYIGNTGGGGGGGNTATYTINCSAGVVAEGIFAAEVPFQNSNTITLSVNASNPGSYSITTFLVNGVNYSATGYFPASGNYNVSLTSTGSIPVFAGAYNYTTNGGTLPCNFSVFYDDAPFANFACKIDGVQKNFNSRARASLISYGQPQMYIEGYTGVPSSSIVPQFNIRVIKNDNSMVSEGSYNENSFLLPVGGYKLEVKYIIPGITTSSLLWKTSSNFYPPLNPPFTINITSITPTRVLGTFSGTLSSFNQATASNKIISEGVFDIPIQF